MPYAKQKADVFLELAAFVAEMPAAVTRPAMRTARPISMRVQDESVAEKRLVDQVSCVCRRRPEVD